jgi:hypothetical protein
MLVSRRSTRTFLSLAITLASANNASSQGSRALPESFSDKEFWNFFSTMSEEGGSFPSENFVSNEQTYQYVIPTLQRSLSKNGVYLGVGPEQNFTYIANTKPRMAVIFDIRRQNAMAHLMYKALFELSATRAEFVSKLFSRVLPPTIGASTNANDLFAAVLNAKMNDSAFDANSAAIFDDLVRKHGFVLTTTDSQSVKHVYASFFEAGPDINYAYRGTGAAGGFRPMYSTYGQIQTLTNADGMNMAFLANEANYQYLRGMHKKNLIIPVVGNFAGPKAIRGVGEFLKQRNATVNAFYLSNVEQYLFREPGDASAFYSNVATLPIDSTSTFIRSVPPDNGPGSVFSVLTSSVPFGSTQMVSSSYNVSVVDSGGVYIVLATHDSAGAPVTTRTVDTSKTRPSPLLIFNQLRAHDDSVARQRFDSASRANGRTGSYAGPMFPGVGRASIIANAGTLVSGLASIRETLDAASTGRLTGYRDVIAMTKTTGWK